MATKISITVVSRNASTLEEQTYNIGYINPALLNDQDRGAAKIDACARALNSLSDNTYIDALLVTSESVNDIINA